MNKIILASHSNLAKGMYDTLKFFDAAIDERVFYICAYEDGLDFEQVLTEKISAINEKDILIFTDIMGGSVNQAAVKLSQIYPVHVVAGMNLPLILSIIFSGKIIHEDNIEEHISLSKEQILYMNGYMKSMMEPDKF
ncbi:PTS sugar transporter subunit IIA [Anaeropeptidivorans aminofermentans]|uniref:PTS sugar transporter subunit IIA n=1 Tax=Anaeropeptidivorans aminofermentans TaxID=2934315 RepID=UPI002023F164|nr:hypothetical protein [Anaeropeptidivorans aminofermentans]